MYGVKLLSKNCRAAALSLLSADAAAHGVCQSIVPVPSGDGVGFAASNAAQDWRKAVRAALGSSSDQPGSAAKLVDVSVNWSGGGFTAQPAISKAARARARCAPARAGQNRVMSRAVRGDERPVGIA